MLKATLRRHDVRGRVRDSLENTLESKGRLNDKN